MRNKYTIEQTIAGQLARARKSGEPYTLTLEEWIETLEYFKYSCAYCGRPYQVIEHYMSIGMGFGTTSDNCLPACNRCNSRKDTRAGHRLKLYANPKVIEFLGSKGVVLEIHYHKFVYKPSIYVREYDIFCESCDYSARLIGSARDVEESFIEASLYGRIKRIK